jgi:hypothetical protein
MVIDPLELKDLVCGVGGSKSRWRVGYGQELVKKEQENT